MSKRRAFEIAFVGLKPGIHEFVYEIDDQFFAENGEKDFTNCTATIKLQLDKKTSFMLLKFEIGGKADVICDRCNNTLAVDLWDEFNMVVKMVDNPDQMNEQEDDPDIFYISRTESHLQVADWIYEFVSLSIPMQRMCDEQEMGGPQCNKEILAMLKKMGSGVIENNHPLEKGLEKFKKK